MTSSDSPTPPEASKILVGEQEPRDVRQKKDLPQRKKTSSFPQIIKQKLSRGSTPLSQSSKTSPNNKEHQRTVLKTSAATFPFPRSSQRVINVQQQFVSKSRVEKCDVNQDDCHKDSQGFYRTSLAFSGDNYSQGHVMYPEGAISGFHSSNFGAGQVNQLQFDPGRYQGNGVSQVVSQFHEGFQGNQFVQGHYGSADGQFQYQENSIFIRNVASSFGGEQFSGGSYAGAVRGDLIPVLRGSRFSK